MLPWLGRPEQGVELVARAVRLNPRHPEWYLYQIATASFYAGVFKRLSQRRTGEPRPRSGTTSIEH